MRGVYDIDDVSNLMKTLNLRKNPTRSEYDAAKRMVLLEFDGGFRFDFTSIDFVVSQWEYDVPAYGDQGTINIKYVKYI